MEKVASSLSTNCIGVYLNISPLFSSNAGRRSNASKLTWRINDRSTKRPEPHQEFHIGAHLTVYLRPDSITHCSLRRLIDHRINPWIGDCIHDWATRCQ